MKLPALLKTKRGDISTFPKWYVEVLEQVDNHDIPTQDITIVVKTYRTKDIVALLETVWQWDMTLDKADAGDKKRINKIISLIKSGEPVWPYVSYWVGTLKELMEVNDEGDYISVPNHGDGWHRLIAANELNLPTVDILFFVR